MELIIHALATSTRKIGSVLHMELITHALVTTTRKLQSVLHVELITHALVTTTRKLGSVLQVELITHALATATRKLGLVLRMELITHAHHQEAWISLTHGTYPTCPSSCLHAARISAVHGTHHAWWMYGSSNHGHFVGCTQHYVDYPTPCTSGYGDLQYQPHEHAKGVKTYHGHTVGGQKNQGPNLMNLPLFCHLS